MRDFKFKRHDLVFLTPEGCTDAISLGPYPMESHMAEGSLLCWCMSGHPLIVSRQPDHLPDTHLQVGLAEPYSWGKRRLAFSVPRQEIARHECPPDIAEVIQKLKLADAALWQSLDRSFTALGLTLRVFGSAALQSLTGLQCMHADSDLDLLVQPETRDQADAALTVMSSFVRQNPQLRLDGEIVNPAGQGASIREWLKRPDTLLVKSIDRVELIAQAEFNAAFSEMGVHAA
ncbi:malonate decarboxylase holo-[acyl-carrier-protein] synthase [Limnobacter litoralis]|uniref:Phosphoribosyl-dephospho-CoA transferase n=1 Tax=Limnobacter litoralis TaxID=481366 RepID=A0ABQ5YVM0_9BURK|nr:malonate decarboxylase holo-[acyl-carrier-protein] synthase [Limnobacter litoralis]GLR27532.1 phosphoribosyl-dephospho-CoA transferase [Limnobacter litoralis]